MKIEKRITRIALLIRRLEEGASVSLGSLTRVLSSAHLEKYKAEERQPTSSEQPSKMYRRSLKLAILSLALSELKGVAAENF